jgi:hypothetical protein
MQQSVNQLCADIETIPCPAVSICDYTKWRIMYQDQLQKAYAMFREKNHDERVWFNDFCFVCFIEFRAKFNPRLN